MQKYVDSSVQKCDTGLVGSVENMDRLVWFGPPPGFNLELCQNLSQAAISEGKAGFTLKSIFILFIGLGGARGPSLRGAGPGSPALFSDKYQCRRFIPFIKNEKLNWRKLLIHILTCSV